MRLSAVAAVACCSLVASSRLDKRSQRVRRGCHLATNVYCKDATLQQTPSCFFADGTTLCVPCGTNFCVPCGTALCVSCGTIFCVPCGTTLCVPCGTSLQVFVHVQAVDAPPCTLPFVNQSQSGPTAGGAEYLPNVQSRPVQCRGSTPRFNPMPRVQASIHTSAWEADRAVLTTFISRVLGCHRSLNPKISVGGDRVSPFIAIRVGGDRVSPFIAIRVGGDRAAPFTFAIRDASTVCFQS
jgi:hypothetical protein